MDYRYSSTRGAMHEPAEGMPPPSSAAHPAETLTADPATLRFFGRDVLREFHVVPIGQESHGETIVMASARSNDIGLADRLGALAARRVRLVPASERAIKAALDRAFAEDFALARARREAAYRSSEDDEDQDSDSEIPFHTVSFPASADWARAQALPQPSRAAFPSRNSSSFAPFDGSREAGMFRFTYVVEEGQRMLMIRPNGTMDVLIGPRRVARWGRRFRPMPHFVAHPGDYLLIRFRDGRQEHLPGPSDLWLDPRIHESIEVIEGLQVAAKEAVVVYSQKPGSDPVQRRIEYGPSLFIPRPGEWLHTFRWHASQGGSKGVVKIPNGLVFQKLWLMPDQMYHDVSDVRTADDALLTIRLMIFFELLDITTMLEATHDPIGDFVNAASSDVVDFVSRHDFDDFKRNTEKLNESSTYRQLVGRAEQCGYRINKVVYRGYGAPERLQQMHDQAIEARTRLQLERATERQAQELEDSRLEAQLQRAAKRRSEQADEVTHELDMTRSRSEADLRDREVRNAFERDQARLAAELRREVRTRHDGQRREHLGALRELGVDLTALLTQGRADRVIELRGPGGRGGTHLHLDPEQGPNDNVRS